MKYLALMQIAARQVWHARAEAIARAAFYILILLIFSRLWAAVDEGGGLAGISAAAFLWYLAITEWVIMAMPMLYVTIEDDVRRGDIAYAIARPSSYLWQKLAEGAGEYLVRLLCLGIAGFSAAWFFSGYVPDVRGLLLAVPLVLMASAVMLLFQVLIGLSTFWIQEAQPVFLIWQKLAFVFGGLILPLDIYPEWVRTIALATPFAPLLYGCGRMAFGFDPAAALLVAAQIVAWGVALYLLVAWMYLRSLRILTVNGG